MQKKEVVTKVEKEMDENEKTSSLELAKQLNVDHSKVVAAIKYLFSEGKAIKVEEKRDINWELTPEGEKVASQGSHEARFFRAIPPEGATKDKLLEIISKDVFEFGQRRAISLGWILPDTKVNRYERLVESIDDKVQKNLQYLEKGKKLKESFLLEYKKMKLVRGVRITSYIVSKGSQISTTLSKQETELTTDMTKLKISHNDDDNDNDFERAKLWGTIGPYYLHLRSSPCLGTEDDCCFCTGVNTVTNLSSYLDNNLGDLLQCCTSRDINVDQIAPSVSEENFHALGEEGTNLLHSLFQLHGEVSDHFNDFNWFYGLQSIKKTLKCAEVLMQSKKPLELKKKNKMNDVYHILGACIETLRIVGIMTQPIFPSQSRKLLDRLNVDANQREWEHTVFTEQKEKRPLGAGEFERLVETCPSAAASNKPNVVAHGSK
ncbi:uncharacterized protein LOC136037696 isoform X2 [Artemia franciscana]